MTGLKSNIINKYINTFLEYVHIARHSRLIKTR